MSAIMSQQIITYSVVSYFLFPYFICLLLAQVVLQRKCKQIWDQKESDDFFMPDRKSANKITTIKIASGVKKHVMKELSELNYDIIKMNLYVT